VTTMAECPVWRTCEFCRLKQSVEFGTDGNGHVVELPLRCGCDAKVRPMYGGRRCLDCPSTAEGRSLRCAACRIRHLAEQHKGYAATWREQNPATYAKLTAAQNERRRDERAGPKGDDIRARDRRPSRRAQRNEARRAREDAETPEERALRNAQKVAWSKAHPESVKRSQDKANALRAADKRAYMHDYATKHVGKYGTAPKCRNCGATIAYDGRGRPRLCCDTCRNQPLEAQA